MQMHHAHRAAIGKRIDQDGKDHAVDGGLRADSEGQGENADRREALVAGKLTHGKMHVLPKALEGGRSPCFVRVLANQRRIAEGAAGCGAGFFRWHAFFALLFFFEREIRRKLAVEVGVTVSDLPPVHLSSLRPLATSRAQPPRPSASTATLRRRAASCPCRS